MTSDLNTHFSDTEKKKKSSTAHSFVIFKAYVHSFCCEWGPVAVD